MKSNFLKKLKDTVQTERIEDKVKFLGARNDVAELLRISNLFVMPSRSEGLPLALLEALATGIPCLASKTGGIPDIIRDGENGILFDRENVEHLGSLLELMIGNERLRNKMAREARKSIYPYTMQSYVANVFNIYETLYNQNKQ